MVVVDPGWDVDVAWTALADGLAAIGATPEAVTGIVVTHVHPDHHGLSARLRAESGAWLAIRVEAATLPVRLMSADTGTAGIADERWLRRCGLPPDVIEQLVVPPEAMAAFLTMAEPDRLLEDGDLVPVRGRRVRTLWTPGHTPWTCVPA